MSTPNDLSIIIRLDKLQRNQRVRLTLANGKVIEGFKWGEVYNGKVRIVPNNNPDTQVRPFDFPLLDVDNIVKMEEIKEYN